MFDVAFRFIGFSSYLLFSFSGTLSQEVTISYFSNDIDAVLTDDVRNDIYIFKGQYYLKIDQSSGSIPNGFPANISTSYRGLFPNFDAVTRFPNSGMKWYIFRGNQYWRLSNLKQSSPDSGYPDKIATYWYELPNFFKDNYDALLYWPRKKTLYIFKDTKYGIYTYEQNKFVSNSTRFIVTDWHGLPNKVDAAVFIDALDAGYIFTGNQYWRVNMTSKRVDQGYPKLILDFLKGHEQGVVSNVQHLYGVKNGLSSLSNANHRLNGHVIKTYIVHGTADCFQKCLEEKGACKSINFGNTTSTERTYLCELNSSAVNNESLSLVESSGFIYYDVI